MAEPTLAPLADPAAVSRERLLNAELAFLYWRERANVAEEQADINASTQAVCAAWARQHSVDDPAAVP